MSRSRCALFALIVVSSLSACGGATENEASDVQRYTLKASIGSGEGVFLDSGAIVEGDLANDADVRLQLGKAMSLTGPGGTFTFCRQDDGYEDVHAIPTDTTNCAPTYVFLGGNSPHVDGSSRFTERDGYVLHDAAGQLYTLLVLTHSISSVEQGGIGQVTFDVRRVGE